MFQWHIFKWWHFFFLLPFLLFSFGAVFLLFFGFQIHSKIEQHTKILSELVEAKQQHKSGIIVLTTDKEFAEILSATIKIKMDKMPKLVQLLDEKRPTNLKMGTEFGQIGAIYANGRRKSHGICPLADEHSNNSTISGNTEGISLNFDIWRFVHFRNVIAVSLTSTVVVLLLITTVTHRQKLAVSNNLTTEIEENYDEKNDIGTEKCVDETEGGGEAENLPWAKEEKKNELIPLEASVWWQYLSVVTNEQPEKDAKIDVSTPAKASILKKRHSKKPFEMAEIQNANGPMKSHRFGNSRQNKDVHFVARIDSPEQINNFSDLMENRFSPKEIHSETFNEFIFFLRHPPDKNGTVGQFWESLEEKMAKRIEEKNWECYSNGANCGHRKKKKVTKWVRFLAAIERRRTNKTMPMNAIQQTRKDAIG